MPETSSPPKHGGGKGFWNVETAGLPNWAWAAVLVVGIGAVYIVPKFFGSKSSTATSSGTSGDTSGIGLAVDPTTGLPYAVEGLVPSGGTAGSAGGLMTTTDGSAPPALTGSPGTTSPPGTTNPPGPAGVFYTTKGGESLSDVQYVDKLWGDAVIRAINPSVQNYGLFDPLPAGLVLQVGVQPTVVPTQPAWPGNTTQPRMVG